MYRHPHGLFGNPSTSFFKFYNSCILFNFGSINTKPKNYYYLNVSYTALLGLKLGTGVETSLVELLSGNIYFLRFSKSDILNFCEFLYTGLYLE